MLCLSLTPLPHRLYGRLVLLAGLACVCLAVLPRAANAATLPTDDLLTNPAAEAGTVSGGDAPLDWTVTGDFQPVNYGAGGGFPDVPAGISVAGGVFFFGGGNAALSTASQTVSVSPYSAEIATGAVNATLSADLGGFATQDDNTVIVATYLNGSGDALGSLSIGPVTEPDRSGNTILIPTSTSGAVPPGTQSIQVVVTATLEEGEYDDGYSDNVSVGLQSLPATVTALPVNRVPPATTSQDGGHTLACATGTWSNSPVSYIYQWDDNGTPVVGATSPTYSVPSSEANDKTTCVVSASNAAGVASAIRVAGPVNTKPPVISGVPKAGHTLACSTGSWSNSPTGFAYQWLDGGSPIAAATTSTHSVPALEEGTYLTCTVTASNVGASASATSARVKIPVPYVPKCPRATGKITATTVGLVTLGATRSRERYLYRHHSDRGRQYEDFFCLTPIGVRVGYGSSKLLKILKTPARRKLLKKVVWASTSNPFYAIDGVRPGESIATASQVLHTLAPLHIGLNDWYLAVGKISTYVLKVRHGDVQEIGIASYELTETAKERSVLMHSFF